MTLLVLLKTGVKRNSLSNPYKTKQTLKRLNVETLYFDVLKPVQVYYHHLLYLNSSG